MLDVYIQVGYNDKTLNNGSNVFSCNSVPELSGQNVFEEEAGKDKPNVTKGLKGIQITIEDVAVNTLDRVNILEYYLILKFIFPVKGDSSCLVFLAPSNRSAP